MPYLAPLWVLLACFTPRSSSTGDGTAQDAGSVEVTLHAPSTAEAEDAATTPLDPASLHPRIQAIGPERGLPTEIVVDFARDVYVAIDGAAPESLLEIQPAAPGELRWASNRRLSFVPSEPLQHDTTYVVTLRKVDTRDGALVLPTEARSGFRTPPFQFLYAEIAADGGGSATRSFEAVFSGPVDAATAGSAFALRAKNDSLIEASVFTLQSAPHKIRFTATSSELSAAETATVLLRTTLTSRSGAVAQPARSLVSLPKAGPTWNIEHVQLREGASSFAIDVVCDDQGVEQHRSYNDRTSGGWWWLSQRCELSEAALAAVHIEPAVDLTVVPSGGGFRLQGDLARGHYQLRIEAGAATIDGSVLATPYEARVYVPEHSASLNLTDQGRYLHRGAWGSLPLAHRNVAEAQVQLRHIPRHNLLFWLSDDQESAGPRISDVLANVKVPLRAPLDEPLTTWLSLTDLVAKPAQGVYEVMVSGNGASDVTRLMVTDLELVAKSSVIEGGTQRVDVWALDVNDHQPISGAAVQLVRPSGQVLSKCTTNQEGGCSVSYTPDRVDHTPPLAVLVDHGDDFAYLRFQDVQVALEEFAVSGQPWTGGSPYVASIYPDRGVYRPGETAHLTALVRTPDGAAPGAGMPVRVEVTDPKGRAYRTVEVQPNAAGFVTVDVPFSDYATTGRYETQLRIADRQVGQRSFRVEEFVPERMSVSAQIRKPSHAVTDPVLVSVDARYLFGGSAEGSELSVTCRVEPASFLPEKNRELTYARPADDKQRTVELGTTTGKLDAAGHAELACPALAEGVGLTGTGRIVAEVAVFEAGSGRTTTASAFSLMHPAPYYLGLSADADTVKSGSSFTVEGTVVDWTGAVAPSALTTVTFELFLIEHEWDWAWDSESEDEYYRKHERPVAEGTEPVMVVNGKFRMDVQPKGRGDAYRVRVTAGGASTELTLPMSGGGGWYGYADTSTTAAPTKPSHVKLELPDEVFVGAETPIVFEAPFAGRALITLESDRVLSHTWVDVAPGPVKWRFNLKDFAPNVYVSVLVLKDPRADDAALFLPARAFATGSVRVKPEAFQQSVTLEVPSEVRSNSALEIGVAVKPAEPGTWVTVAVVDEGVLSLTDFESPDPFPEVFPKRLLGVATYETLGWHVARASKQSTSRTGGDDAGGAPARVSAVKPVALWSGLVELDAKGEAVVRLDVPEYRGQLRVMAVTASPKRMGHADASVLVRDPLVVQATLPRFLIAGDQAQVPVFLSNLSGAAQTVTVSVKAENLPDSGYPASNVEPVSFVGASEATFKVADGGSHTVVFRLTGKAQVGAARITVRAAAGSLVSEQHLDLPLSPAGPRVRNVQQVALSKGEVNLSAMLQGWVPTTERTSVWVTPNPYAQSMSHLAYLIGYPYGCVEQTTSATLPLLHVRKLVPVPAAGTADAPDVDRMVQSGVDRVLSMQTTSGGFAYWPGGIEPSPWASVYATHLLLNARDAGFDVSITALSNALTYLETEVIPSLQRNDRYGYTYTAEAEAYAQYVLAVAGRPQKARAAVLVDTLSRSDTPSAPESLFLAKAALYQAGDRRYADELARPDVRPIDRKREGGWSFYSDLRRRGLMLAVSADLFGNSTTARSAREPLARLVASELSGRRSAWFNTQEIGWAIVGLGKHLGEVDLKAPKATLRSSGKDLPGQPVAAGLSDQRWSLPRASEFAALTLTIDETPKTPLFAIVDSSGVRNDTAWQIGGEGLLVSRQLLDARGNVVDPTRIKLGQLVYVRATVQNTTLRELDNLALVDRVPAGWEIENPRLGQADAPEWASALDLWESAHMNVRDDRVEVFGMLAAKTTRTVVYAARAVTAGSFTIPPIEVEAMYDPTVWARAPGGTTVISGDWDAFFL